MWTYFSWWKPNAPKQEFEICLVLKATVDGGPHYKTTILRPCGQIKTVERYDSELFLYPDSIVRIYIEL